MTTEYTLPTEKITANSVQLAVLKNNFPQCFDKHGKFIVSKLQEILQADGVDLSRESYSLNWLGKSYARVLANEPIRTMLSEDTEHNQQEQNKNSHNLLIQGDNLEVLKHLKGAYTDKIKMIYIDPPYNTGSDGFVYQDDRSFSAEQFAELAGVDLDEAQRVLDFTQSNANSHSAWLTFIYPRLYIAKQLLKDDGVIFISIDDNEQAQLKILCDEVFGEGNFVSDVIWEKKFSPQNDAKWLSDNHDYILIYAKNKERWFPNKLARSDETNNRFSNPDNDPRGVWASSDMSVRTYNIDYDYPIKTPSGKEIMPAKGRSWSMPRHKIKELIADNRIWFGKNGNNVPRFKTFLSELSNTGIVPLTIWKHSDVGHNQEAKQELKELFSGEGLFDTPKPTRLLSHILKLSTSKLSDDIILDFFAGSGTTAHAVLKQNAEQSGNLQFICVQIAEQIEKNKEAFKAGYHTIFEITKDRVIKAGEKLVQEYPESTFERGFKIFKTCDNFLPASSYRELKQINLSQADTQSITTDFSESQLQDILTTWKGLDKILLSENLNTVNLSNYFAYGFGHVLYLVNKGFQIDALKDLIKKLDDEHEFQVSKLVIFGHHFNSATQREIDEAMKNYNNKKSIPVDVVVRY
ncbi:site-specific DNA-methyltransferase [Acinetobacter ursingii]|uniref:site-specific DNA-methyltransferase n=1 Tax=Acinetobacter ursingii TaxID=108980 RepID=UPI002447252C|nr:site-specific DNA-methyltransferase [Acinetobacter ursingii]MDH2018903.1 site-specific DNA-methyltransferase [Acinetobacter ursingii]MDH2071124.1 site-specific DNA-methyltransferase [Acinetobacter ursingii]